MQLSATSSATSSSTSTSSSAASAPGNYDAFLKLFITQLKNQDPTKPMDPTTTVSQLATFSQVEQLVQSNKRLDALIVNSGLAQASAFIGKTITPADGSNGGVIKAVTVDGVSMIATLTDGRKVDITSGATIS